MASSTAISTPELRLWHRVSWMIATLFWVGMIPHWAAKYSPGRKLGFRAGRGGGMMGSIATMILLFVLLEAGAQISTIANITTVGLLTGLLVSIGGIEYSKIRFPNMLNHVGEQVAGDPNPICIDEFVGMMLAAMPIFSLLTHYAVAMWRWHLLLLIAFFAFRYFDTKKPLGIKRIEVWVGEGPAGIMLDDIVAGFYAQTVVVLVAHPVLLGF